MNTEDLQKINRELRNFSQNGRKFCFHNFGKVDDIVVRHEIIPNELARFVADLFHTEGEIFTEIVLRDIQIANDTENYGTKPKFCCLHPPTGIYGIYEHERKLDEGKGIYPLVFFIGTYDIDIFSESYNSPDFGPYMNENKEISELEAMLNDFSFEGHGEFKARRFPKYPEDSRKTRYYQKTYGDRGYFSGELVYHFPQFPCGGSIYAAFIAVKCLQRQKGGGQDNILPLPKQVRT